MTSVTDPMRFQTTYTWTGYNPSTGTGSSQAKPQTGQDWRDKDLDFQRRRIQRDQQDEREALAAGYDQPA